MMRVDLYTPVAVARARAEAEAEALAAAQAKRQAEQAAAAPAVTVEEGKTGGGLFGAVRKRVGLGNLFGG